VPKRINRDVIAILAELDMQRRIVELASVPVGNSSTKFKVERFVT
jgi:hypothetical protein